METEGVKSLFSLLLLLLLIVLALCIKTKEIFYITFFQGFSGNMGPLLCYLQLLAPPPTADCFFKIINP